MAIRNPSCDDGRNNSPPVCLNEGSEILSQPQEDKLSRFARLWQIIKGTTSDIKLKANVILNPDNPKTSTNLSANQVDFVSLAYFLPQYFPEMKPLETFAEEFLQTSTSKEGWGVDRIIQYEQAVGEKRIMQLGLRPQEQKGKEVTNKEEKPK